MENAATVVPPVVLVESEHVATILDALDRYDVAMTGCKHLAVDVARQWRRACVL